MGYPTIWVHAPRKRPFNPDNPTNRVVLFEIDSRHPGGQAFLAEGDEAEVWSQSPEVKKRLGTSALVLGKRQTGKGGAPIETIDPDSLHAVQGLGDRTIDALAAAGITTVGELVDAVTSGDIETINGVGPKRLEEIVEALVQAGHIEPSQAEA